MRRFGIHLCKRELADQITSKYPNISLNEALVDLYDATNGDQWERNDNWMTGDPCDNKWYRVECTNSDVTSVRKVFERKSGVRNVTDLFSKIFGSELSQRDYSYVDWKLSKFDDPVRCSLYCKHSD